LTDWLPIVIAVIALIVAGATAWATWIAPANAARIAEQLRSASARAERRDELKLRCFLTLMAYRAFPFALEAVQMFNVIDAAFMDAPVVRNAWASYFESVDPNRHIPQHDQRQRLIALLLSMASEMGLTGIGISDLTREYSPQYIMRRINIETMQATIQEADLQRTLSQASANTTPQTAR